MILTILDVGIIFHPFYLLLSLLLFATIRLIKEITQGFTVVSQMRQKMSSGKNTGYWTNYYIIFGVITIYSSAALLFSSTYAQTSLSLLYFPILLETIGAIRYVVIAFTEKKNKIIIVCSFFHRSLFTCDSYNPSSHSENIWRIFMALSSRAGLSVTYFSEKSNFL